MQRVKGSTVQRPVVYGSVASLLPQPIGDHTHRWTIAVLDPWRRDAHLTSLISRVTFVLHDTYAEPRREITEPPFMVTETGWGEFDVVIQVHFHPALGERSISWYHRLRLHSYAEPNVTAGSALIRAVNEGVVEAGSATASHVSMLDTVKASLATLASTLAAQSTVNCWYYDELVFVDPTEAVHQLLVNGPTLPDRTPPCIFSLPSGTVVWSGWSREREREELDVIQAAVAQVERQGERYKNDMARIQQEIPDLRREVAQVEKSIKEGGVVDPSSDTAVSFHSQR